MELVYWSVRSSSRRGGDGAKGKRGGGVFHFINEVDKLISWPHQMTVQYIKRNNLSITHKNTQYIIITLKIVLKSKWHFATVRSSNKK